MKIILSTLLVIGTFLTVSFIHAAEYILEKPHTQILFFCDHLGFSKSKGEFLDFDGRFFFDPTQPENSTVQVSIATASIEMHDKEWNAHLRNEDFFDVKQHPHMSFKSTRVIMQDDRSAIVEGELTLLAITRPVSFKVVHNKSGKHPFNGNYIAGFTAQGTIKRSEFGMTYGIPALGDEVEIYLSVEGVRQ